MGSIQATQEVLKLDYTHIMRGHKGLELRGDTQIKFSNELVFCPPVIFWNSQVQWLRNPLRLKATSAFPVTCWLSDWSPEDKEAARNLWLPPEEFLEMC